MEAQTAQPPSDDPSSAAAYPRWVMLERDLKIRTAAYGASSKTLAAARTSTGHLIQVSLRLAEPPAVSCVCLEAPDAFKAKYSTVVAAHGDSVLIEVSVSERDSYTVDHFVYNAGDAAADPPKPPSLRLLPFRLGFGSSGTGIVRRGEDELVVAQLRAVPAGPKDTPELTRKAELCLFRCGESAKSKAVRRGKVAFSRSVTKRLPIRFRDASEIGDWDQPFAKQWNAVFPVGDGGLLCWVDLQRHVVLLCDVFEETPRIRSLPLPRDNVWGPPSNRNVCATAGGGALKFVNIFPRCCCGDAGDSCCKRSRHAYTIHTWTMRIIGDDDASAMEWVMDGVVDATELWALDSYKGLRCLPLDHPVVSMDEPELIYFWLHQVQADDARYYVEWGDRKLDLLTVNMTSKTIHSVSRYENGLILLMQEQDRTIPSKVSNFFNSYPCSGSDGTLTGQRQKDIETPPPAVVNAAELTRDDDDHASNPTTLQPAASCAEPCVHSSEIFQAFQEIPSFGLDHEEIVKAYSILSRDNGRRFRSFIRLPQNVRKDWLSVEIKASEE